MNQFSFLNASQVEEKDVLELITLIENQFDTRNHPEQMQINDENRLWVRSKIPECALIIKDKDIVIGSTLIIPSILVVMNDFISGKIHEADLVHQMQREEINYKKMQAIYLCSAFIKPEYRGKGLALKALIKSIHDINPENHPFPLYYWAYSQDGKRLADKLAFVTDFPVLFRT